VIKFIIDRLIKPRWIVGIGEDNYGELGIRIFFVNLWYYKWPDPMYISSSYKPYAWRMADKREFGETVKSEKMEVTK